MSSKDFDRHRPLDSAQVNGEAEGGRREGSMGGRMATGRLDSIDPIVDPVRETCDLVLVLLRLMIEFQRYPK